MAGDGKFALSGDLIKCLKLEGLLTLLSATDLSGAKYIDQCQKAGVPRLPN
jgi:hypothetical protein